MGCVQLDEIFIEAFAGFCEYYNVTNVTFTDEEQECPLQENEE